MPQNVASPSAAVEKMRPDWDLVRALLGGTRAMREAGETYLPRWPNEDAAAYAARKKTAVLFPAFGRTVTTLAAKPFSKPVTVDDDTPEEIEEWLEDIDLEGRNIDVFSAGLMEDCLGYGLCGILVDYPDASDVPAAQNGTRTVADERAAGLRPYWVHIRPWQILGWRAERKNGAWVLMQLRLMETVEEPDGDHATKLVQQVRVLEPGKWTIYRQRTDVRTDEWVPFSEGVTTLGYVPFVACYGKRTGYLTAEPPLIEVANLNVAHWQSSSDQQTILHVARVPILTVTGAQEGFGPNGEAIPWEFTVGASAAVKLPVGASMAYVEHSGKAIEAGAADLDTLEERMRQAGAELLVIAPGKVTATQVHSENAVAMSALQRITLSLEDELNTALQMTADWIGAEDGGSVHLFRDFGAATLAEASAELLLKTTQAGYLSKETYLSELKRRGILSAEVDAEDEAEMVSASPALGMIGEGDAEPAPRASSGTPEDDAEGSPSAQPSALDLSPVVEAIREAVAALGAVRQEPAPSVDWPAVLAAMKAPAINVTAPAPDLSGIAAAMQTFGAALSAIQPAQVNVSGTDTEANTALIDSVAAGVASMSAAAEALQRVAQELPAAVAQAAPKGITAEVVMPRRTATARFQTDAAGNIIGASLTDESA